MSKVIEKIIGEESILDKNNEMIDAPGD